MEGGYNRKEQQPLFRYINIFLKNLKKFVRIWILLSLYIVEGKGKDENNNADNGLDALRDCSPIVTAFTRLPAAQLQPPVLFPPSTSPQRVPRTGHGCSQRKTGRIEGINRKEIP